MVRQIVGDTVDFDSFAGIRLLPPRAGRIAIVMIKSLFDGVTDQFNLVLPQPREDGGDRIRE